jgi:hypothetical protein
MTHLEYLLRRIRSQAPVESLRLAQPRESYRDQHQGQDQVSVDLQAFQVNRESRRRQFEMPDRCLPFLTHSIWIDSSNCGIRCAELRSRHPPRVGGRDDLADAALIETLVAIVALQDFQM